MREALKLKPLCTSYLFSAVLLGAVLALIALLPTVAVAGDKCPCATSGSALKLHRLFLQQEFEGEPTTDHCLDDGGVTEVQRYDSYLGGPPEFVASVSGATAEDVSACSYAVVNGNGQHITEEFLVNLPPGQVEACRKEIRKLIAKLDDCPTP